jgi:hypothetical protein
VVKVLAMQKIKITIKTPVPKLLTTFILDWREALPVATWTRESVCLPCSPCLPSLPPIKWREIKLPIQLVYLDRETTEASSDQLSDISSINLLKSMLQKCVRRQLDQLAVRTAAELIHRDPNVFLRRLGIIMVEDVGLREEYSVVVWLTGAVSKGFVLQEKHVTWLLRLVESICHDSRPPIEWNCGNCGTSDAKLDYTTLLSSRATAGSGHMDLVYSLLLRASYGGMACDRTMLQEVARLVICPEIEIDVWHDDQLNILPMEVPRLMASDLLIEAADFHCCPGLISTIQAQCSGWTRDRIQSAIWEGSSKINYRNPPDPQPNSDWEALSSIIRPIQANWIRSHFQILINEMK